MVGIFSRIAGRLGGHHHEHSPSHSAHCQDEQQPQKQISVTATSMDTMEQFMPIEHPQEPLDVDKPVRCPPPEPCIVHDGRIWKERIAARRIAYPNARGRSVPPPIQVRHPVLKTEAPAMGNSFSAPERSFLTLLE